MLIIVPGGIIGIYFQFFFDMTVCCVFSLESPHRGDSNEYTQNTIFNIKEKSTLKFPKSAARGFFQGTQKRARDSRGKQAISGRDTVVRSTRFSGAESRRKVLKSRPGFAIRIENSLSMQQKMGTFFESGKNRAAKERDGLRLSSDVPKILKPCLIYTPSISYCVVDNISIHLCVFAIYRATQRLKSHCFCPHAGDGMTEQRCRETFIFKMFY